MKTKEKFTEMLITRIAKKLGIDISNYDMSEMVKGMSVELEHGSNDEDTNITSDDAVDTFKILLAHIKEIPDYYTRLENMENEAGKINKNEMDEENLNESKRFQELCGIIENENKKQLKNENFKEKPQNKTAKLLSEELNMDDFDVIKFKTDEIGKDKDEESNELYKMEKNSEPETDDLDLEEF